MRSSEGLLATPGNEPNPVNTVFILHQKLCSTISAIGPAALFGDLRHSQAAAHARRKMVRLIRASCECGPLEAKLADTESLRDWRVPQLNTGSSQDPERHAGRYQQHG